MRALDRLLTIVVTATLTSAVWIVAGGTIMQRAGMVSADSASGAAKRAIVADAEPHPPAPAFAAPMPGARLVIPVRGKKPTDLTDTFSAARAGGARIHDAIDIMADEGTPVIAAAPGKVEKLFLSKPGGNTIYIRSPDGRTIYYYAHLKSYAPGLAEQQMVTAGQALGEVGHTGNASPDGPHLHFAVMSTTPQSKWWQPATALNPYPLLGGK
jgi:murein DD-endopeptidase MepM/ murein hydrolase activator NlpD